MMLKRLWLAFGLLLVAPTIAFAQGGVTLIQSSVEPLPNCTPAVQGKLQPSIWDITANAIMYCTAPNTWTGPGGGGGTIGGSIANTQIAFGSGANTVQGSANATLDLSGDETLAGTLTLSALTSVTALATDSSGDLIAASYQGNGTLVQLSTGSTTPSDCVQFDASGNTTDAGAPCGSGGGSGTVTSITFSSPLTGGTITTTGTVGCATCVVASSPGVGLAHFAGSTQTVTSSAVNLASADVTGLLPNANLAHPLTTVNGVTCTLGSTCTVIATSTIGTPNSSQSTLNFITSTVNATGFTITPSNPTGGNEKFELTGTLAGASFPALTGDTTTTLGSLVTTTSHVNGNSFPSGVANHQIPVGTATSTFTFKTVTDCNAAEVSSAALNFTQSTNAFSCNTVLPMTTLGDTIYGGASGVATQLAGPTGVNGVPQVLTETPSGGVATAPGWFPGGIIPRVVSGGSDTVLAADRANWIWITTAGDVAETLATAGATGFDSGFVTRIVNAGTGTATVTSASTILRNDGTSGMTLAIATLTECTIDTDNTDWYAVCH